jgi:hypothetical protein
MEVSFSTEGVAAETVDAVVDRAVAMHRENGSKRPRLQIRMDLIATHANGNPLDWDKLRAADDFNFAHDLFGIESHIDRATGELTRCFSPRCSLPEQSEAAA